MHPVSSRLFAGFALSIAAAAPTWAACGDRPGTPTNVTARTTSENPPTIQVSWTNTATETVFWDVEMTDAAGRVAQALPAGVGRGDTGKGLRVSNSYSVPVGEARCFRVKARTARHTEGCVSLRWSNRTCATVPNRFHHGPDTCKPGFVWREATLADRVCVQPRTRDEARRDNAAAAQRKQPGGGPYGPDTCKQGFVWREAVAGDRVCVVPATREKARQDNAAAAARRERG